MIRRLSWVVSIIGLVSVGELGAQAPAGNISTYAGSGKSGDDGALATDYRLSSPSDIAVDALGNIHIADSGNNKILKIDRATQIVTTVAGTGRAGYNGDFIPATSAELDFPVGIAFDPAGNLYISDNDNARIRRVDRITGIITTYAGTGVSGYNADNIPARLAELNDPYHISFDPSGNLYIADASNNRVRKVNTAGIITTVAGTGRGGYNGDNQPAIAADLNKPLAALADNNGNLYIADNKNLRIRLVSAGTITTLAGTGATGSTGDGGPAVLAKLKGPNNIGIDPAGHLYIADEDDNKIRRVDRNTLIINTVAGNGGKGYTGDDGPAVEAAIATPFAATFDAQGLMYIAQYGSDVVRLVSFAGSPASIAVVGNSSPQTTRVNTNFAERLTAVVRDGNGTGVSGVTVTYAAPAGGASATLSAPTAITDAAGEAFVFATANSTAGSYSVTATTTGVATPAAFSLTNSVSTFVDIAFVQQPSNTTAGVAINPPVTVRVRDLNGNPVGGAAVTVGIFASSRSIQGTVIQMTDGSGIATFTDLKVNTVGTYTLQAATGAAPPVGSSSFTVAHAAPRSVTALAGSGQSAPALTPFADELKALVTDEFGNVVPAAAVTFAAPTSGPSATFGGTATVNTGLDGIATSPILTANELAGTFNVMATVAGASSATFNLTNLAPVPKILRFVQQPPSSTAAGSAMTPPIVVQVQDEFQNPLSGVQVVMLLQGPSQALTGTTTRVSAANGLATFNDLSINQAGANYRLDAVAVGSSAEAFSNSFTITGGAPAGISIVSGGAQSATVLTPYAIPLTVIVEDQYNNPVSGATVAFTAPSSGASGLFSGSPTASVVTDAAGQAAAPVSANGTAGAFTATAGVGVFSVPFQLANTAGTPGRIVFSQQPPATVTAGAPMNPPVQAKVEDGSGNGVPAVTVTLTTTAKKRSAASLTATTDAGGFATFGALTINTAGDYVLEAVAGAISAQSNTVTVTAGPAALMTAFDGSGQTSTVATLFHPLQARVTDSFGNPVSGVSVTFTPPSSGPSVTGIPATAATGLDGIARSPAITANTVAGTFQVTATGGGSATFTLTNTPGAGILKFVQQPSNTTAGTPMADIKVQIQDSFNNPVNTPDVPISLQLGSKNPIAPPVANTDVTGTATFQGLSVSAAGAYNLLAVAAGLQSGRSAPFLVTPGTAANIVAVGGTPGSTVVETPFPLPLVAEVTDSFTNPVPNTTITFTVVPSGGAGATFAGSPTASATTDQQGLAVAPTLTANTTAGTFTVTATVDGKTATWTLTNLAGAGSQIIFDTQPSTTAAGTPISPPVVVKVADSHGNPVSGATVVLTAKEGPGSLEGTQTGVTASNGQVTFADLTITASGSYQVEASAVGVLQRSATFQVTAKTTNLSMQVADGTGQFASIGTPYALPLKVLVLDEYDNPVPGASVVFTALSIFGANVTFNGSPEVITDAAGIATSPTMTANAVVGLIAPVATTPGAPVPAVFALANTAGPATQLVFVQQPTNITAGAAIAPPVTVRLLDAEGNPARIAGVAVTVQLNPPGGGFSTESAPATQNTTADGVATFAGLRVAQAGTYQLQALSEGLPSTTSTLFGIGPATASSITVVEGNGQSAAVTTNYVIPLKVSVQDSLANPVPGVAVTFTAPSSGASVTFSGPATVTTDSSGVAAISVTANTQVGSFQVATRASGTAALAVFGLTNVAGSVSHLAFAQQPSGAVAGAVITPPVTVQLTDSVGNNVAQAGVAVTLSLNPAAGRSAAISGTTTVATSTSGLASFADLRITTTGSYQLTAAGTSLVSAQSSAFTITPGTAAAIQATAGTPQSANILAPFATPLQVLVSDSAGNPLSGVAVTFAAPATGASATLSSATATTDSSGHASVSAVANATAGSYTVTGSLAGVATPASFALTNVGEAGVSLVFTQQPSNTPAGTVMAPVTVRVTENGDNPVSGVTVALTAQGGPGVLAGAAPVATNASGLATFSNLSIDKTGTYVLQATDGTRVITSTSFSIGPATASSITVVAGNGQSAAVTTNYVIPLKVSVQDSLANPIPGVAVTFTAPSSGASATFSGPATVTTDSSGVAAISVTANTQLGSFQVTAIAPGTAAPAVFSLTNVPGSVSHLAFVQQPSGAVAGAVITPPVTVQLTDSVGNNVAQAGVAVTLSLNPAAGRSAAINGTTTVATSASGLASFADLRIATAGSYQLTAIGTSLVSAQSSAFTITPSVSIIAISGTGQTTPVNTTYTFPLTAAVRDTFGNAVPGVPVTFTAPASGPGVVFAGPTSVLTDNTGVATSPSMAANSQPGSFQVTATAQGAPSHILFSLTNTAGGTGRLSFVQHPTDTQAGAVMTPVSVQLLDSAGNPVQTAGVPISLLPISGSSSVFGGNLTTITDSGGMAIFNDLSCVTAGTYQLAAQSGSLGVATSTAFRITTGPPAAIRTIAGTPQSTAVLTAFVTPLEVTVTDSFGNQISGVSVFFTAPTSGASGTFGGAPNVSVTTGERGTAAVTLTANGTPGTYVVPAATAGVSGSATFSLTNSATPSRVLAFVQQPGTVASSQAISPAVTVQVRDSSGAPVNTAGIAISMTLASGTGELSGSNVSVTAANGIATFDNLRIDLAGTKHLRATANELTPAESNSFMVTAGPPSRIAAIGKTLQITVVSQVFAAPLQTLVTDSMGNPVSGTPVTFSVPATGPSGSFAGGSTVTTGANGIAVSPLLTANSTPGWFSATATTPNLAGVAAFALVILPSAHPELVLDKQLLTFTSEVDQPAPPPKPVTVSAASGGAVAWAASRSASWLTVSPSSGVTPRQVSVSVNPAGLTPGAYIDTITFAPPTGEAVVLVVSYTISPKPALTVTPGSLIFQTFYQSDGTIPVPPAQTVSVTSTSRPVSYQASTTVTSPPGGTWLKLSAAQGQTPDNPLVSVTPSGLPQGIYSGSVLFQPMEAGISPVFVPVTLIVGCNRGACVAPPTESPVILSIVNSASFHIGGSPGAAMTLFGRNLSTSTMQAPAYPLPTVLGTTVVTVNGAPVPLYYVSPGQINFQMPSNAPLGNVPVDVNVGGQKVSSFNAQAIALTAVDPGLYMNGPRAAALNPDLTPHTAATPQAPGAILAFYVTGQGKVKPAVPDGSAAPGAPLAMLEGTAQATFGGQPAEVIFAGLAPGFAGLAQVNVRIPQGLNAGDHPAFIVINGIPSNAGLISVR